MERKTGLLLMLILYAAATDGAPNKKTKRDLQYIKDALSSVLFGHDDVKGDLPPQEIPPFIIRQPTGEYKVYGIPEGYKSIHIKSIPEDSKNKQENVVAVLPDTANLEIVKKYLGTKTEAETITALKDTNNLVNSGVLITKKEPKLQTYIEYGIPLGSKENESDISIQSYVPSVSPSKPFIEISKETTNLKPASPNIFHTVYGISLNEPHTIIDNRAIKQSEVLSGNKKLTISSINPSIYTANINDIGRNVIVETARAPIVPLIENRFKNILDVPTLPISIANIQPGETKYSYKQINSDGSLTIHKDSDVKIYDKPTINVDVRNLSKFVIKSIHKQKSKLLPEYKYSYRIVKSDQANAGLADLVPGVLKPVVAHNRPKLPDYNIEDSIKTDHRSVKIDNAPLNKVHVPPSLEHYKQIYFDGRTLFYNNSNYIKYPTQYNDIYANGYTIIDKTNFYDKSVQDLDNRVKLAPLQNSRYSYKHMTSGGGITSYGHDISTQLKSNDGTIPIVINEIPHYSYRIIKTGKPDTIATLGESLPGLSKPIVFHRIPNAGHVFEQTNIKYPTKHKDIYSNGYSIIDTPNHYEKSVKVETKPVENKPSQNSGYSYKQVTSDGIANYYGHDISQHQLNHGDNTLETNGAQQYSYKVIKTGPSKLEEISPDLTKPIVIHNNNNAPNGHSLPDNLIEVHNIPSADHAYKQIYNSYPTQYKDIYSNGYTIIDTPNHNEKSVKVETKPVEDIPSQNSGYSYKQVISDGIANYYGHDISQHQLNHGDNTLETNGAQQYSYKVIKTGPSKLEEISPDLTKPIVIHNNNYAPNGHSLPDNLVEVHNIPSADHAYKQVYNSYPTQYKDIYSKGYTIIDTPNHNEKSLKVETKPVEDIPSEKSGYSYKQVTSDGIANYYGHDLSQHQLNHGDNTLETNGAQQYSYKVIKTGPSKLEEISPDLTKPIVIHNNNYAPNGHSLPDNLVEVHNIPPADHAYKQIYNSYPTQYKDIYSNGYTIIDTPNHNEKSVKVETKPVEDKPSEKSGYSYKQVTSDGIANYYGHDLSQHQLNHGDNTLETNGAQQYSYKVIKTGPSKLEEISPDLTKPIVIHNNNYAPNGHSLPDNLVEVHNIPPADHAYKQIYNSYPTQYKDIYSNGYAIIDTPNHNEKSVKVETKPVEDKPSEKSGYSYKQVTSDGIANYYGHDLSQHQLNHGDNTLETNGAQQYSYKVIKTDPSKLEEISPDLTKPIVIHNNNYAPNGHSLPDNLVEVHNIPPADHAYKQIYNSYPTQYKDIYSNGYAIIDTPNHNEKSVKVETKPVEDKPSEKSGYSYKQVTSDGIANYYGHDLSQHQLNHGDNTLETNGAQQYSYKVIKTDPSKLEEISPDLTKPIVIHNNNYAPNGHSLPDNLVEVHNIPPADHAYKQIYNSYPTQYKDIYSNGYAIIDTPNHNEKSVKVETKPVEDKPSEKSGYSYKQVTSDGIANYYGHDLSQHQLNHGDNTLETNGAQQYSYKVIKTGPSKLEEISPDLTKPIVIHNNNYAPNGHSLPDNLVEVHNIPSADHAYKQIYNSYPKQYKDIYSNGYTIIDTPNHNEKSVKVETKPVENIPSKNSGYSYKQVTSDGIANYYGHDISHHQLNHGDNTLVTNGAQQYSYNTIKYGKPETSSILEQHLPNETFHNTQNNQFKTSQIIDVNSQTKIMQNGLKIDVHNIPLSEYTHEQKYNEYPTQYKDIQSNGYSIIDTVNDASVDVFSNVPKGISLQNSGYTYKQVTSDDIANYYGHDVTQIKLNDQVPQSHLPVAQLYSNIPKDSSAINIKTIIEQSNNYNNYDTNRVPVLIQTPAHFKTQYSSAVQTQDNEPLAENLSSSTHTPVLHTYVQNRNSSISLQPELQHRVSLNGASKDTQFNKISKKSFRGHLKRTVPSVRPAQFRQTTAIVNQTDKLQSYVQKNLDSTDSLLAKPNTKNHFVNIEQTENIFISNLKQPAVQENQSTDFQANNYGLWSDFRNNITTSNSGIHFNLSQQLNPTVLVNNGAEQHSSGQYSYKLLRGNKVNAFINSGVQTLRDVGAVETNSENVNHDLQQSDAISITTASSITNDAINSDFENKQVLYQYKTQVIDEGTDSGNLDHKSLQESPIVVLPQEGGSFSHTQRKSDGSTIIAEKEDNKDIIVNIQNASNDLVDNDYLNESDGHRGDV